MRVGIVTVFDAVNYGSYLQALCLQEIIKQYGHEVIMIKTGSLLYERWRFTSLFTYKPTKIVFKFRLAKGYFRLWKRFHIEKNPKDLDLLIVGSDEMWELNNVTMVPLPQFFGIGIDAKKKVTYAVSSNSTCQEEVKQYSFAVKGLKLFDHISIRDTATFDAYRSYIDIDPVYVTDPTLLVDLNKYMVRVIDKDYIMCYTYKFKSYMVKMVKEFAKKINKRIIVVGQNFKWADKCIPADALEFLGWIQNADFIITDTFHGVTLSIGLKKEFVSFAYKPKVYQTLEQFELLDRNIDEGKGLMHYYQNKIDYTKIYNEKIDPLKQASIGYIEKILGAKEDAAGICYET